MRSSVAISETTDEREFVRAAAGLRLAQQFGSSSNQARGARGRESAWEPVTVLYCRNRLQSVILATDETRAMNSDLQYSQHRQSRNGNSDGVVQPGWSIQWRRSHCRPRI